MKNSPIKPEKLFNQARLRQILEEREKQVLDEIKAIDMLSFSDDSVCGIVEELSDRYKIEPLVLDWESRYSIGSVEIECELSQVERQIYKKSRDARKFLAFSIPYSGDKQLWHLMPIQHPAVFPEASLTDREVTFYVKHDPKERIEARYQEESKLIFGFVEFSGVDVNAFNRELPDFIRRELDSRQTEFRRDQELIEYLGFQLVKRARADEMIPVTETKRLATVSTSGSGSYAPTQSLSEEQYKEILITLELMTEVLERSPSVLAKMDEEALRTLFLVVLNGKFEVNATGETFNGRGKTDIYLPLGSGNVFIAECKFWKGPKAFKETLDQLFRYVTRRDTKTAIILFNRGKQFSKVVESAKKAAKEHDLYIDAWGEESANTFSGVYKSPDDSERTVIVTTLVFDIPRIE